jgi:hypothetical protein
MITPWVVPDALAGLVPTAQQSKLLTLGLDELLLYQLKYVGQEILERV